MCLTRREHDSRFSGHWPVFRAVQVRKCLGRSRNVLETCMYISSALALLLSVLRASCREPLMLATWLHEHSASEAACAEKLHRPEDLSRKGAKCKARHPYLVDSDRSVLDVQQGSRYFLLHSGLSSKRPTYTASHVNLTTF
eukprot:6175466-Pleurochrysis_carterae.AAC.2